MLKYRRLEFAVVFVDMIVDTEVNLDVSSLFISLEENRHEERKGIDGQLTNRCAKKTPSTSNNFRL